MKRPVWSLWFGLAVAVGLLAWSMRGVDLPRLGQALAHANYWYFLLACALTLLAFYVRAVRWGVLLRTVKHIPNGSLFSATMIGFAANNLLPARLGELVRAWAIGRQERISRSSAFATVVVERVADVFLLFFFFTLLLFVHPFGERTRRGGWLVLAFNLVLLALLVLAERNPFRTARFSQWLASHAPGRIRPRVRALLDNFVAGLGVLRRGPAIAWVVFYSLVLYLVTLAGIQACLMAFDLHLPWYAAVVVLVATTLGFIVAPTPGYVGAVQVACVWALSRFQVDKSQAFSFSLFFHASNFFPITAAGLWFLTRQGLSLGEAAGAAGKEVKESA